MKISAKGQYALRIMLDLANNNTGEYITIKSIAARQTLPEKYLEQIMTSLLKAGYVKSVRGSKGGYKLAYDASKYTVGKILRVIEGSLSPVAILDEELRAPMDVGESVTYEVWREVDAAITKVVDGITLEHLVQRQKDRIGNDYMI